ncbi:MULTISPECIES: hypothetical protein [Micromonospora]|uniref:Uncharacterized protein n=1 Tax=Micromonospora yangpuensis TaxID=683228 RepID=A0A1C6UM79_9ACTN|nr:hypothetical protein [Micromonospora yangpuensis]GGM27680.1 hypothetical protein GCM10012279_52840 [Micromonospora yangpuensis]SCL55145.1 hypothetical protein GA0070617_2874 [Micromonospora yangpuensis]
MSAATGDGEPPDVPSGPSPLDAVPDMRATAKWLVAAAAAVGSLLLGVGPLTAVGRVGTAGDALWAFVGLVVALAGVGVGIWFAAEALTPPVTTLATLDTPALAGLRARIGTDPGAFYGPFGDSVTDLRAGVTTHAAAAAQLAILLSQERDPTTRTVLDQALRDAQANERLARQLQRRLLEFVHVWQVRQALRRSRIATLAAMAVVALGAVLFLLATADRPVATPAPTPSPSNSAPPR